MNDKKLKIFNVVVLLLSIILTFYFLAYASGGAGVLLSGFTLWGVSPFLVLLLISHRAISHRSVITTTLLSILCFLGTYLYFDSLFVHLDAQGALVFLFLPIYQLLSLLVGFGISAVVGFIQKRRQLLISNRF